MKRNSGQGLIEYVGAMIVGGMVVTAVMAVSPTGYTLIYNGIIQGIGTIISDGIGQLPS